MDKSPDAFRTISEVADELDIPQHVLRFWETRFSQIRPLKRAGGRRYYRPEDVDLLRGISRLLYGEGYTIRGLQRIFKEQGGRFVLAVGRGESVESAMRDDNAPTLAIGLRSDGSESDEPAEDDDLAPTAPSRPASTVADIVARAERGTGLFDRLRNRDPERSDGHGLSGDQRRELQLALQHLLECKRLLDQTRSV